MKRAITYCLVIFAVLLGTALGFLWGTRLAYQNQMIEVEEHILTNSTLTSRCREIVCDESMQKFIVTSTDVDLYRYGTMQQRLAENWIVGSYTVGVANILTSRAVARSLRPSQHLRDMAEKHGCGVGGRLCTPNGS
jgi:hypothetical protein